jgi:KAP family P-loop domain
MTPASTVHGDPSGSTKPSLDESYPFWSVVIAEENLGSSLLRDNTVAGIEVPHAKVVAANSDFVFLAGRGGTLRLLGRARAILIALPDKFPGPLLFKFENFQPLETSVPAPRDWITEKGPALPGHIGEIKGEFRRMVEQDVAEAASLITHARGRRLEANDEPESSDRTAPQLSDLLSQPLSPRTREIFDAAERLAAREGDWAVLTSAHLLDGLLEMGNGAWKQSKDSSKHAVVNLVRMIDRMNPEFLRRRLAGEKSATPGPNFGRRIAPDTRAIFDLAKDLSVRTGHSDGRVSVRHLVVAVFALVSHNGRETAAQQILREADLRPSELQEEFVTSLANSGPTEERAGWRQILGPTTDRKTKSPDQPAVPTDPLRAWLPSFNADLSSGEDKLGIATDVAAMASLIVSNSLQPPLSIGLFGNWGSGKSFFMEKLRDRIRALSRSAEADDRRVYWPNVVTVEFNAWHYVDANLWASLVAHLFAVLRAWGKPEEGVTEEVLRQKNAALNQLKVATEAREAAQKRLGDAERALEQATHKHDEAVGSVRLNNHVLSLQLARDLWAELKANKNLTPLLTKAAASLHQSHLVATESVESVEELYQKIEEISETGGRLRATGWTMLHGGGGRGQALAWLIGGAAAALLLGIKGHWWSIDFGPAAALVTQATAIVIGVAQWVTRSAQHVSKLIEPLDTVRRQIEAAFKAVRDERDQLVSKFKKEVEASMVQVTTSAQAVTTAEQALAAAKAAVQDATTARMIGRFIEGRAASDDYRKHLGIVSTIREDFDRLSKLITAHNQLLLKPSADAIVDGASDLGINRIVLFVDDLDRCPPARVVEVLQAIHLLLAFPLFVVVVGVDSRWVEHSLAVRHPELLKHGRAQNGQGGAKKTAAKNGDASEGPATPSDYLEKIFQIPYRVRRMDESGCRDLIDALVASDREIAQQAPANNAGTPLPGAQSPAQPPPNLPISAVTGAASNVPANVQAPQLTPNQVPPPPKPAQTPIPKITIESLRLTEPEILMMRWLAPWIGRSPRATKRFVNIYRLIKAAVPPSEQRKFIAGGFRAPMVLLATATKGPELTRQFLAGSAAPGGWVLIDLLEKLLSEQFPDGLPEEAREAQEKFAEVSKPWPEPEPDVIRVWQRRVAQFSFEEYRKNETT